jgi:hypothetical protein
MFVTVIPEMKGRTILDASIINCIALSPSNDSTGISLKLSGYSALNELIINPYLHGVVIYIVKPIFLRFRFEQSQKRKYKTRHRGIINAKKTRYLCGFTNNAVQVRI